MSRTRKEDAKKRARAYHNMTTYGRDLAVVMDQHAARQACGMIMTAYNIGARLAATLDDDSFGTDYIARIARYLNYPGGARRLYALIDLADAFNPDYVKFHSLRNMASGDTLDVGHWLELTRIANLDDVAALIEDTLSASWSADQLAEEIMLRGVALR